MQKKNFYKILILFVIFFFQQNSFASIFEGIPRVIDGDSLEINNNKIRLFGIDAQKKNKFVKNHTLLFLFGGLFSVLKKIMNVESRQQIN